MFTTRYAGEHRDAEEDKNQDDEDRNPALSPLHSVQKSIAQLSLQAGCLRRLDMDPRLPYGLESGKCSRFD